jgi:hypothetical protein
MVRRGMEINLTKIKTPKADGMLQKRLQSDTSKE